MNGSNLDVSVGMDRTVGWTPATLPGDQIVATLAASEGEVKCVADDQAGTLTMPVAMLGKFNAQETGYLSIARVALSDVTTSNATVEIGAMTGQGVNVQFTP
jgi:hypothetical protein